MAQSRRTFLPIRIVAITVLSLIAWTTAVQAADNVQITPFTGYRAGGEFEDYNTGREISLSEDQSYGFTLGLAGVGGSNMITEFLYSVQSTDLSTKGLVLPGGVIDVEVEYFHIGRKRYLASPPNAYVVGSVGATHFEPDVSGLSSDSRFSLGFGTGIDIPFTPRLGLRLEGRGFATLLNSNGAMFCSTGGSCSLAVAGSVLWQFEANAGLIFRF